jgi:hypothetical protein
MDEANWKDESRYYYGWKIQDNRDWYDGEPVHEEGKEFIAFVRGWGTYFSTLQEAKDYVKANR